MADGQPISQGYDADPSRSYSLQAKAYTDQTWFDADLNSILAKTWQWVRHVEKTRKTGAYVTVEVAGQPIAIAHGKDGTLRAVYNVCKHRAHELL